MKNATLPILSLLALLCGCRSSGTIAVIPHADGCGSTEIGFAAVGGGARPGVMIVWTKTHGHSNSVPPQIQANVHGAPSLPSLLGGTASAVGNVGAALALGTTWPDSDEKNTATTTIIQGDPREPPIAPPARPVRPPWGPPNGWQPHPHPHPNRGR